MFCLRQFSHAVLAVMVTLGSVGAATAQEFIFKPGPQLDINRVYRVNRFTGEVGACQYGVREGQGQPGPESIGVTLCYAPGAGAGPQTTPGDYDLVASNHQKEGGIFRVNRSTGEMSVCYVLQDTVVCTPPAR